MQLGWQEQIAEQIDQGYFDWTYENVDFGPVLSQLIDLGLYEDGDTVRAEAHGRKRFPPAQRYEQCWADNVEYEEPVGLFPVELAAFRLVVEFPYEKYEAHAQLTQYGDQVEQYDYGGLQARHAPFGRKGHLEYGRY